MGKFEVQSCVSDYAIKSSNGGIVVICNSKQNAELIAAILEKDSHCNSGRKYVFTEDDYYRVASEHDPRTIYGVESVLDKKGSLCRDFAPGVIVRHFKGNLYEIKDIVRHSETGEPMVTYQALYGVEVDPNVPAYLPKSVVLRERQTFVRPLDMFSEKVDREKYPYAGQEYRMEIVRFNDVRVWTPNMSGSTTGREKS